MNIHEYQAKKIFAVNGVPVPEGYLARSPIEAEFAMRRIGTPVAVVKAQIHAGGRGKAGGVKVVKSLEECNKVAGEILGSTLVTHQTGPNGKLVNKVYVEAGSNIEKEYYLSMLIDRENSDIVIMFSTEGGMDIEKVAADTPEKIIKVHVKKYEGLQGYHIRKLCFSMGFSKDLMRKATVLLKNLYSLFNKYDYSLIEINPLVLTSEGDLLAIDGKMNFDDNALFRHKDIDALRDFDEEDSREIEASKYGLNYIGLDGQIGCLVNGAGLAMATMDIIKYYGGSPANFLDVGGSATEHMVTNAFRILLQDRHVKTIFVNIFGGIMKCDIIAKGLVSAAQTLNIKVPLVVRLEGTNVDLGLQIIKDSGLNIIPADNMADGAQKAVKYTKE